MVSFFHRYCRAVFNTYVNILHYDEVAPLDHPGVQNMFHFLPPELDVATILLYDLGTILTSTDRKQMEKYNYAEIVKDMPEPVPAVCKDVSFFFKFYDMIYVLWSMDHEI